MIAPGHGHGRQADAGIAGGGLDDGAAGLQRAGGLRLIQHLQGDAVLGASRGVEALQLYQDGGVQLTPAAVVVHAQQGGIAHKLGYGMIDGHKICPFFSL